MDRDQKIQSQKMDALSKFWVYIDIGPHTLYMLIEKDYPLASCLEIIYQMVNGARQLKLQKA